MKLREMISASLKAAGDLDEPVFVRIVTRNECGSVDDSKTKIYRLARIGLQSGGTYLVAESDDFVEAQG